MARSAAMDANERTLPLSNVMAEIARDPDPTVTLGEIIHRLGHRAFGAMFFVFAAPNWLPMPPGASTFLGFPLVLLSPQMLFGVRGPWLPNFIDERPINRETMAQAFHRLIPWLQRIEKVSKPRLTFLFGPVGDRVIALACFLLSLVLILPIPFGNMAPAAAIALFGLAMLQRDGALALVAYAITGASGWLLFIGGRVAIAAVEKLIAMLDRLMG
ncbi:MAG TPA: exopolysaccharide biosynthesis protein [Caulobacter sp.]|nr:exopolysaccharide biosynthesis protein [Caulobacter sp.]